MGQGWRFAVAWLSAAVAAVTVSWFGVRIGIAPAITDEAPVAIDVNRHYTEVRFGVADAPSVAATSRPAPSRTTPRPSRPPSAPVTRRPAPSRPATATPSASPSPSAPDRRPRYRINAQGGDVIVAYSPARVDVIGTRPLPGYLVSVTRRSNTLVVVRLAGGPHTSIVTVFWNAGPGAQIFEESGGS